MMGVVLAVSVVAAAGDSAYRGALELLYDGSTDTAIARLESLSKDAPEDPIASYLEALALVWKIEQNLDDHTHDQDFENATHRAIALSEARLRIDRDDARAFLARGAAHGVTSRLRLDRGASRDAAREAVLMRDDLLQVRRLDSLNKDALFGLGLYDYYTDVLPRLTKVLRFFAGMPGGDRARGLAEIEESREGSAFHRTEAMLQLYEIHAFYEASPDRAQEEIAELRSRYPGSPFWALKLAEHERDRLGLYQEAASVARDILASSESGHANYSPTVAEMAKLSLGESLLLDLRLSAARDAVLGVRTASLLGRREFLLGRVLELEGDRQAALARYGAASTDPLLRRRARRLLAAPLSAAEVAAATTLGEARRLLERGHRQEAAALCRDALRVWPASTEAALRVAEDDLLKGRPAAAGERLRRLAATEDPQPPWVRPWTQLLLGRLYDLEGNRSAAVNEYKKVYNAPYGQTRLREWALEGLQRAYVPDTIRPASDQPSKIVF